MTTSFARFLSVAFHPLLMPTFVFGILLFQVPNVLGVDVYAPTIRLSLLVLIFVGTFGVPALLIYYLYRSGLVQTLHLTTLADRRLPFFLTALVYVLLTYLFAFRMDLISTIAPEIGVLLGSIALSILLVGIISLYWQISAHSVGISGVVGILAGVMLKFSLTELFVPLLLSVLLTGLVGSARLRLNAHTPAQIGAGVVLGLIVSLVAVFWLV
ncbi:hypothetical protein [Spirosoma utsteinense]|uniref:PAP2 superfamily protein n=1 Tax=Spirosoma utsteinense TaxID=2585773 RepID=A0ABR6W019_9BACT|nr:hypothetical protein [Spirosoma utsteinense]MBC3786518.1 hypothetical protein [Spirosoma utsteinense]MBC3789894.1 hypothetical protein [Spirosoma utsteinense]